MSEFDEDDAEDGREGAMDDAMDEEPVVSHRSIDLDVADGSSDASLMQLEVDRSPAAFARSSSHLFLFCHIHRRKRSSTSSE